MPQVPPALHVSTPLPEHCVAPCAQAAVHMPALQTAAHGEPVFCQVPVSSHVCGCCPLHWVAPGVQVPAQAPATHAKGQVVPVFCHAPVGSHVCGCVALHCLAAGAHDPVHVPPTQVWPVHEAPGTSFNRSGPHWVGVVWLAHTSCPGVALAHSGSMAWQRPWLAPGVLSQFSPAEQIWRKVHAPPEQRRTTFFALPAHASSPGVEQAQPRVPTAPVPGGAQAPTAASPASGAFASTGPSTGTVTSIIMASTPESTVESDVASGPPSPPSFAASAPESSGAEPSTAPVMSPTPRMFVHALEPSAHDTTTIRVPQCPIPRPPRLCDLESSENRNPALSRTHGR
jgi:hypothetical protein